MSRVVTAEQVTMIPAKKKIQEVGASGALVRVAAYCRVSTEEENQQNSYATQISYYTDYINSNPNWKMVGIFADEGISGTRTKNRTQFNKMITMARRHRIDLILCKSISRFARNTVDCLDFVRELKSLGVTVIFEKENINTSSMTSEFAISLYASFAQAESESISKNVTWGIEKSFREGKVRYQLGNMLGYRMGDDGKPYIVESEAEIVRKIFRMYADGYTSQEIADELVKNGDKRRDGTTNWTRNHVYQILQNEKYVGDAVCQKTYTVNCITHERAKNHGEKPMYHIQDCHDAIIDRDTYDTVRLELQKRKIDAKRGVREKGRYHTKYCLSRIMVCPHCGSAYKRTTWISKGEKVGVWRCSNRMDGTKLPKRKRCTKAPSYHEDVLQRTILEAVNSLVGKPDGVREAISKSKESLTAETQTIDSKIVEIMKKLSDIESQRDIILESVTGSMFEQMSDELKSLNNEESEYAEKLIELKRKKENNRRSLLQADTAVELLKDMKPLTEFDDLIIDKIIARVEATKKSTITITFRGGFSVVQEIINKKL